MVFQKVKGALSIPTEMYRLVMAFTSLGVYRLPRNLISATVSSSSLTPMWRAENWLHVLGDSWLECFDDLGPVYGKAGQVALSRLDVKGQAWAEKLNLTRLYKDWPSLSFKAIQKILDKEIPGWRERLTLNAEPLGVASIAQVHKAKDLMGKEWVVKIVKPQARKRLIETLDAHDQLISAMMPFALTNVARRSLQEMSEVSRGLRNELDLELESRNIERIQAQLRQRKTKVLQIPEIWPELCSSAVIVQECFDGTPLSDLVSDKVEISEVVKKKLAKTLLSELLVQVFELGLFHADPHAGNLILLDNGNVGLFDWGLTGELTETDRRHIASILKSVVALDLEGLAEALYGMAEDEGEEVSIDQIQGELRQLSSMIKEAKDIGKKIQITDVFEESMRACDRLGLRVPEGLLLMAKTLVTVDGLARVLGSSSRVERPMATRIKNICGSSNRTSSLWMKYRS